jgi:hypothetical protein
MLLERVWASVLADPNVMESESYVDKKLGIHRLAAVLGCFS